MSLFRQGEISQELARYNTSNNSLIFTEGLTEEDLSNWRRIQAIIQQSSQEAKIRTQDFEL
ncbi:MAG: hypothetical protein DSM106950_19365 [Stigonema ocellatum SAG 48.90 = DSM 106950]|nr:hypothetical protein [Stigonema ocellatum SAG 48.90 = DSM 106950]